MTADNKAYTTLRGGGLPSWTSRATPMAIVGEYGTSSIGRDGCGGVQNGKDVYLNNGTGTPVTNPSEFPLGLSSSTTPSRARLRLPLRPELTRRDTVLPRRHAADAPDPERPRDG